MRPPSKCRTHDRRGETRSVAAAEPAEFQVATGPVAREPAESFLRRNSGTTERRARASERANESRSRADGRGSQAGWRLAEPDEERLAALSRGDPAPFRVAPLRHFVSDPRGVRTATTATSTTASSSAAAATCAACSCAGL